jgi:uncharacterized membrane protein (UPF0127 family)
MKFQTIIFILLFFALISLIFLFYLLAFRPRSDFCQNACRQLSINQTKLWVKIADSDQKRTQGLSGIPSLKNNEGLLFILPYKQMPIFWMKGMLFDLDFIWIAEGKVVDLTENVLAPSTNNKNQIARVQPKVPVDMVLEVNKGFVKNNQVKIGDSFSFND